MYGNNINNPFIMSNIPGPMIGMGNMMRGTPMMGNTIRTAPIFGNIPRSGGLSSLFGLGRTSALGTRPFNLSGLLNNTSKALGVVKEAIPIVKEVGPMMGNMRQMLKIASIFKDETETFTREEIKQNTNINVKEETKEKDTITNSTSKISNKNENEPNFFI